MLKGWVGTNRAGGFNRKYIAAIAGLGYYCGHSGRTDLGDLLGICRPEHVLPCLLQSKRLMTQDTRIRGCAYSDYIEYTPHLAMSSVTGLAARLGRLLAKACPEPGTRGSVFLVKASACRYVYCHRYVVSVEL